jgi:hypothetical protein
MRARRYPKRRMHKAYDFITVEAAFLPAAVWIENPKDWTKGASLDCPGAVVVPRRGVHGERRYPGFIDLRLSRSSLRRLNLELRERNRSRRSIPGGRSNQVALAAYE